MVVVKTLKIEDKEIPMVSTAGNLRVHRQIFKKDMLGEYLKVERALKQGDFEKMDTLSLAEMMWTCAYRANNDIKPFDEWLEEFNSMFSFVEVLGDFMNILDESLVAKVEAKKKKAPTKK